MILGYHEMPGGLPAGSMSEEGTLAEKRERMGLRPGQLDPQTSEIGHRMRELAGRKAYLRNFWYAAGGCSRHIMGALLHCQTCLMCWAAPCLSSPCRLGFCGAPFVSGRYIFLHS